MKRNFIFIELIAFIVRFTSPQPSLSPSHPLWARTFHRLSFFIGIRHRFSKSNLGAKAVPEVPAPPRRVNKMCLYRRRRFCVWRISKLNPPPSVGVVVWLIFPVRKMESQESPLKFGSCTIWGRGVVVLVPEEIIPAQLWWDQSETPAPILVEFWWSSGIWRRLLRQAAASLFDKGTVSWKVPNCFLGNV